MVNYTHLIAGSFAQVDQEQFSSLVCSGFGRPLIGGYFGYTLPTAIHLVLTPADEYIGAAVIEDIPGQQTKYLDKIVIAASEQGNGVGSSLFHMVHGCHSSLAWRAMPINPFNGFYQKVAGEPETMDDSPYYYYLLGVPGHEKEPVLNFMRQKLPTLTGEFHASFIPNGWKLEDLIALGHVIDQAVLPASSPGKTTHHELMPSLSTA
ncbi:hypothetical protein J4460_04255 [Candidatus Woesearchaeota archaeon]|nr:hypothetical protein [Candidatus Woesearchaeota archaeon]HIH37314.1 hypothetical protein [Candidatus Woesearchaeota archaeon]HIH48971.1 hypothetical protein [Candidatus Woesearchaeota archaeon]HIJ03069.1 hypothetical protein [Candidatus Woesearchaeota archaeon]